MSKKLFNTMLNINFIITIIIIATMAFALFPVQTGIYRAIFFAKDFSFSFVDIIEIIFYYLSIIVLLVSLILLMLEKKNVLANNKYEKPLFNGGLLMVISGFIFFVANTVCAILIHLISFEIIYGLLGLFLLGNGLAIIFFYEQNKKPI